MSRLFFLLAGCLALLASVAGQDDKPAAKPRADVNGDPLPPAALLRIGSQRFLHGSDLSWVTFSRDDRAIISVGSSAVRAWDAATGKELFSHATPEDEDTGAIAVSADTKFIARAVEGKILIRDLQSGKLVARIDLDPSPKGPIRFSPDGRAIAWVAERAVCITELSGQRKTREFKGAVKNADSLSFSGDGKRFAAADEHERIILWDVASGKRLREYRVAGGEKESLYSATLDPEGKSLFTYTSKGHLIAWETDSLEPRFRIEGSYRNLALLPDGKTLATFDEDTVKLFDARTGKAVGSLDDPNAANVSFSHDGKLLAGAGNDGRIRLWDVKTGKPKNPARTESVRAAAFANKGKEIVTVAPKQFTHWSMAGKAERRVDHGGGDVLTLSPCGRHALLYNTDGAVRLLDTEKAEVRKDFDVKVVKGIVATFDPAGDTLAVLSEANLSLYAPHTGKKRREWKVGDKERRRASVAFSADARTLCTSCQWDHLQLRWEVATGKQRRSFELPSGVRDVHPANLPDAVAMPDGRTLALMREQSVFFCDVEQRRLVRSLEGASGMLKCLAVSPSGKLVAAGGNGEAIHLWESATGKMVATLRGHRGSVTGVAFSPDGKTLLSRADDDTAIVWSVAEALKLPQEEKPKARTTEAQWAALADDDPEVAESALREMAASGESAVAWLAKKLEPARAADRRTIERLVEQLGSDTQAQRDDATQQLIRLDEQARAAVEAAQKLQSPEIRKRAALILKRIEEAGTGAEARPLRAVELLEMIGDVAAKKVLTTLSRGASDARLTKQAAASLSRLEARGG